MRAPRASRREWAGLAVLALPCLLYAMDLTVLNVAVPELSADLEPSSAELLWIVDVYGFLVAALLITMGTLGDRIGRRRLLLVGAAAFAVGSVVAAFSTSAEMLIVARALLGVAGATVAPSTLALIFNMFQDPRQRTVAVGVWVASYSAGALVGPVVGGVMLELFWWGSVFLLAVPIMALVLVLGPMLLPEFRDPDGARIDPLSVALSLAAVLAFVYGLKQLAQDGLAGPPALAAALGVALAVAFVRRQRALTEPMLDLDLFRVRAFSAALATYALSIGASFGAYLFLLQHLQLVLGYSPLAAGAWMIPSGAGFLIGGALTPLLARRLRPSVVMAAGLLIAAAAYAVLARTGATTPAAVVAFAFAACSVGVAPVFTLATDLVVGAAPRERAGAASAISETGAELGAALGIAVLGSVGAAVYRVRLADDMPAGVPAADASAARDTLGAAGEVAAQLPERLGAPLLDAAREAFAAGLQLAAVTGAVLLAALAVAVAVLLRHLPPTGEASPT